MFVRTLSLLCTRSKFFHILSATDVFLDSNQRLFNMFSMAVPGNERRMSIVVYKRGERCQKFRQRLSGFCPMNEDEKKREVGSPLEGKMRIADPERLFPLIPPVELVTSEHLLATAGAIAFRSLPVVNLLTST